MRIFIAILFTVVTTSFAIASPDATIVNEVKDLINNTSPDGFSAVHFESNYHLDNTEITDHASGYSDVCYEFRDLHRAKGYVTRLVKVSKTKNIGLKTGLSNASSESIKEYEKLISNNFLLSSEVRSLLLKISNELLKYHSKIKSIPGWENKLRNVKFDNNKFASFRKGAVFHDAGFPFPESPCFVSAVGYNDNGGRLQYTEFDVTLDAWLYSFWYRRLNEGTFEITHNVLLAIVRILDSNA